MTGAAKPKDKPEATDILLSGDEAFLIETSCSRCRFFKGPTKAPGYASPCQKLGVIEESPPCAKFTPDLAFLGLNFDETTFFFNMFSRKGKGSLSHLAALINWVAKNPSKKGAYVGYVNVDVSSGKNHWRNYLRGWVVSQSGENVQFLTYNLTAKGKASHYWSILKASSVISEEAFLALKESQKDQDLPKHLWLVRHAEPKVEQTAKPTPKPEQIMATLPKQKALRMELPYKIKPLNLPAWVKAKLARSSKTPRQSSN